MIDVTGIDKVAFAKAVYQLSKPQGLGFLNFKDEPLSDEDARTIARAESFNMDYVYGRACKMNVFKQNGKLMINESWYDHTDEQYEKLLAQFNISRSKKPKHNCSCNCENCQ